MTRSFLIICLFVAITNQALFSQNITNVQVKVEGNAVVVSYQLQSSNDVDISLYLSEDGCHTFSELIGNLSGDVGSGIQQGQRQIVWDVLKERELLVGKNIVFRIKAVSPYLTFHDPRDGKSYKSIKIGNQVWMAENLAYKPDIGNYCAYKNDNSYIARFGYLYEWETACSVCPSGWHLPSDAEWEQLLDFVGSNPGLKLKAKNGWKINDGTDEFRFSALPCGTSDGKYFSISTDMWGSWWTSTECSSTTAWQIHVISGSNSVGHNCNYTKKADYSVRCIKD